MNWDQIGEVVIYILVGIAAVMSLSASIGLLRFRDVMLRLHAATKPQILGLFCALLALTIQDHSVSIIATYILIIVFQILTQPIAAHMAARAAYRTRHVKHDELVVDELAEKVSKSSSAPVPSVPDTDEEIG